MAPTITVKWKEATDLGALLDVGDGAVVTLVAGETRLAAHGAVLAARSPVFEAMFHSDTLEASTGEVCIPDVEGAVLRQLLAYCYTRQAPQLPAVAPQLLVAADKYGLLALKSACEKQVAAQLTNENAAASATLAVRHSCPHLTEVAVAFIREHDFHALATQGWADAIIKQPRDVIRVSQLLAEPPAKTRIETVTATTEVEETAGGDLGALLDARDGATVTLVAGQTRLVAHRAVLAARSPVLKAMFHHDTVEAHSGQVTFPDTEGPALRKLLAYCYSLQVPEYLSMAPQLLVAADTYGLSSLKAACERQVATSLTVSNAAAAAALAVRHSCTDLNAAAVAFIKAHFVHVVGTQGWADMMRNQTEDLITVSQLLAEPPAEIKNLSAEEKGRRLIKAADKGALEEVWVLLASGADLLTKDLTKNGKRYTALHRAATSGHEDVVRCLLVSGAEVDARSSAQFTPLHRAAFHGRVAVMRLLIAASADLEARCAAGRSPLLLAALAGRAEAVRLLLRLGADPEARNDEGKTALQLGRLKNHQEVIDVLTRS